MAYSRFHILGVVQGVGFRPYIYNACVKAGLKGMVQNVGDGVIVEVDDKRVFKQILKHIPPLSRIDELKITRVKDRSYTEFNIKPSQGKGFAEVPPDLFLCQDCYREINQKTNRRYKYHFTTCTNCGPRYSMTLKNPYDRPYTAMKSFPMCSECEAEYTDPQDRRYHAQTIACKVCGPKLSLWDKELDKVVACDVEAIEKAAEKIKAGEVVAIKGVGGFHLACGATSKAVNNLRQLTKRKRKPYALLCRDVRMARKLVNVKSENKKLLESFQRPIVVLPKKVNLSNVSELNTLGVMLPYTALHYLLFDYLNSPIVLTSSNMSGKPITIKKEQQLCRYVLNHDREIINRVDDTVIKPMVGRQLFLRRSRGYAPQSIYVKSKSKKTVLALGAEQNCAVAIYKNQRVYMSPYIGNIHNFQVFKHYEHVVDKLLRFTDSKPDTIITDLHPDYQSTKLGQKLAKKLNIPQVPVQHHLAHAYSVSVEHDDHDFSAIVADGMGYGEDGKIWGGEVFENNTRIGHLEYQPQMGGDAAVLKPGMMLYGILKGFMNDSAIKPLMRNSFSTQELKLLSQQYERKINMVSTSSCGRVLDAAAFMLNVCDYRDYEGRPAILLDEVATVPYKLRPQIVESGGMKILQTTPLFKWLVKNRHRNTGKLAATVLTYLAAGMYEMVRDKSMPVVWSGGCVYSKAMSEYLFDKGVITNQKSPPGDGGIALGQIGWYLANAGK
jgi:hydrogenase maturation protein HypF